jgi:hypothetical protein
MKPKGVLLIVCLFGLGLSLFFLGCGMQKQTIWVEDYLITFYSMPRTIQVGDAQLAVRVQDRDYRILPEATRSLEIIQQATGKHTTIATKIGLGKDVRGWANFPVVGEYTLLVHFAESAGQTKTAQFSIRIPTR